MLGVETQYKLKEFFTTIADLELQTERQRQILAAVKDFEPYSAFSRIDRNENRCVNALEIYAFLKDNEVNYTTIKDCQLLIKYFDLDGDGTLNYQEYAFYDVLLFDRFMQLLLPCDDMYLRSAATQRPTYTVGRYERLPLGVEKEITHLLEREIAFQQKVEIMKSEISQRYDWTNRGAFESIVGLRESSINQANLYQFLRTNGHYANESEITAIIRRLDIDADKIINFNEFVESFKPLQTPFINEHQQSNLSHNSSFKLRQSNYEELKRGSSPLRLSDKKQHSPLRSSLRSSPLRETRYTAGVGGFTASSGFQDKSYMQQPLTSSGFNFSNRSPQRSRIEEPKLNQSPTRARVGVTRELLQRSHHKSPVKQQSGYLSPQREQRQTNQKKQSPLKQDDQEELIGAFKEQINLEKELEDAKIRLSSQPDFNLMDGFQMLDQDAKGWITAPELVDSLNEFGNYTHKDDVYLFVRRYDKDSDGRILYSDFCDAFTPKSVSHSSTLNYRRAHFLHNNYPKSQFFSRETRDLFFRTFKVHFTVEESAELLRQRLGRRPNFNAHDAFVTCDVDNNGYITKTEFKNVLKEYGFYPTDNELSWLIDRYDKNHDGRISYSEFIDEIMPKSPTKLR